MESFGLMDASGVGFYLLLPLYHCLHPFTVEMCACTFSIACKHGDWGYGQCKCTIWHSELEVHRARGNRGEERNRLPYVTACRMSTAQKGRCLENSIYVQWMNMFICEDKICDCLCPRCIGMHCVWFLYTQQAVLHLRFLHQSLQKPSVFVCVMRSWCGERWAGTLSHCSKRFLTVLPPQGHLQKCVHFTAL